MTCTTDLPKLLCILRHQFKQDYCHSSQARLGLTHRSSLTHLFPDTCVHVGNLGGIVLAEHMAAKLVGGSKEPFFHAPLLRLQVH
eukprot:scaffold177245_cov19-Tisochrysis_lutea.AAC.4